MARSAIGVGTKVGVQRYDVAHATEEDVVEGLADLCGDTVDACGAVVTFSAIPPISLATQTHWVPFVAGKYVITQMLISGGTVVGVINGSAASTSLVAIIMWGVSIVVFVLLQRLNDHVRVANYHWLIFGFLIYHHKYLVVELTQHAVHYSKPKWLHNSATEDSFGAQRAPFAAAAATRNEVIA
eukprot:COSAG04_NODE_9089_length_900_cov_0.876404_1_plen_184_part_00